MSALIRVPGVATTIQATQAVDAMRFQIAEGKSEAPSRPSRWSIVWSVPAGGSPHDSWGVRQFDSRP